MRKADVAGETQEPQYSADPQCCAGALAGRIDVQPPECGSSLTGLRAAELGVLVLARGLIPPGLAELAVPNELPALGEIEFVLGAAGSTLRSPALQLSDAILAHGERLLQPGAQSGAGATRPTRMVQDSAPIGARAVVGIANLGRKARRRNFAP